MVGVGSLNKVRALLPDASQDHIIKTVTTLNRSTARESRNFGWKSLEIEALLKTGQLPLQVLELIVKYYYDTDTPP